MPTQLDFLKAKVLAYKTTLEGKTQTEKQGSVSSHVAQQVNDIVDEIKKAAPEAAPHMPHPITAHFKVFARLSDVSFLELEMILNQVLAVLDVVRAAH